MSPLVRPNSGGNIKAGCRRLGVPDATARPWSTWIKSHSPPVGRYVQHYPSKQNGVTLHTWTEREGRKEENFYITGLSGTPVASWFREKLRTKHLTDILDFP